MDGFDALIHQSSLCQFMPASLETRLQISDISPQQKAAEWPPKQGECFQHCDTGDTGR
jgi:hypothetical protein